MVDMIEEGIRFHETLQKVDKREANEIMTEEGMGMLSDTFAILHFLDFGLKKERQQSALRGWVDRLPANVVERRPMIKSYLEK